jgi:hypothetical protein
MGHQEHQGHKLARVCRHAIEAEALIMRGYILLCLIGQIVGDFIGQQITVLRYISIFQGQSRNNESFLFYFWRWFKNLVLVS